MSISSCFEKVTKNRKLIKISVFILKISIDIFISSISNLTLRRNKPGDREKALQLVKLELENEENHSCDMVSLCGSLYKDQFIKSFYVDYYALENAIYWFRKGFEIEPNEYTGINLATLLVIDGNEFHKFKELQHIGMS